MHPSPAALRHVRELARAALSQEAGATAASAAGAGFVINARFDTEDVVSAVVRHRLPSLLGSHVEDLRLPEDLAQRVLEVRAEQRRLLLVQQLELGEIHQLIAAGGVPCLVIKGLPLAVQTTGDPGARGPGDFDLLVPPPSVPTVHRLLLDRGWRLGDHDDVTPGTWAWRHVLRNTCSLTYVGPGSNIDLHWRLDTTVDSLPPFEDLWSRRTIVALGGCDVPTLAPRDALAQSAFHAAKDRWRWIRSLVDINRLAGMESTWAGLGSPADLHRIEVVTLAVTRAAIGLPPEVPVGVLARIDAVPSRTVERALRGQVVPAPTESLTPGRESALNFGYLVRASTTPRDVRTSAMAISLPVKVVAGIESRTAWTGMPVAVWRRLVRTRRRAVAWARHEPASAAEVVRTP